jgi:hypothetical protein
MASKPERSAAPKKYDIADLSIAGVTGLAFAFIVLFICVVPLTNIASGRDFIVYWATGQQLVHHASPYDADAMMRIEHSAGLSAETGVMLMRNPPWALPLAYFLGFLGLQIGAFLWSLVLLACLIASVGLLWHMHGRPRNHLHWLGISFAPALLSLTMGQTSLFMLLGLVLFLRLHRAHPFLAGMSIWICALKPHLFLPLGVVLLAWILFSRNYKILAGATVAMAASCAAAFCIDPTAWADYAHMMRTTGAVTEQVPCLSVALRVWLSPPTMVLNYLPATLGCVWALVYFWPRRHAWDWMKDGSLLMLVSLLTAPYSWIYDDGLAIPALLQGAYLTRSRISLVVLALASVLLEIEFFTSVKIYSFFYLWTAPAWLAWYLFATKFKGTQAEKIRSNAVVAS